MAGLKSPGQSGHVFFDDKPKDVLLKQAIVLLFDIVCFITAAEYERIFFHERFATVYKAGVGHYKTAKSQRVADW